MTQEEFGGKFGIVKSTVSLYVSGKSTPNDQIKKQICNYFHVSADYLLGLDSTNDIDTPKIDANDEFLKAIEEININDPRAKQIILNYWHLSPANKELFWLLIDKLTKK